MKVIAEKTADGRAGTIIGVHMVGPWVTEQLGQGYLAVNWEATVDEVAAFIQPHPTLSELFGDTVQDMTGRRLHDDPALSLQRHRGVPLRPTRHGGRGLMADIQMPQLGETVTEGTITKWFKQVGDAVAEDEPCSRSRPTRSTPRCRPRSVARCPRSWSRRATPSTSAWCWRVGDAPAGGGEAAPEAPAGAAGGDGADGASRPSRRPPRPAPRARGRGSRPESPGPPAAPPRPRPRRPRPSPRPRLRAPEPTARGAAQEAPAPAARRRRPGARRAAAPRACPEPTAAPAVAGRPPPHQREQPRPGGHRGHRTGWAHHPQGRARRARPRRRRSPADHRRRSPRHRPPRPSRPQPRRPPRPPRPRSRWPGPASATRRSRTPTSAGARPST